jgi:hypothetical protein
MRRIVLAGRALVLSLALVPGAGADVGTGEPEPVDAGARQDWVRDHLERGSEDAAAPGGVTALSISTSMTTSPTTPAASATTTTSTTSTPADRAFAGSLGSSPPDLPGTAVLPLPAA